jgi:outer membrane protein assembly factor BamD
MRASRPWILLFVVFVLAFPRECPAPLVYRPGEGWTYETPGTEGKWTRPRAKDQLEVAEQAFADEKHGLAIKAARRVVKVWPLSDYAPRGQYLLARSHEAKGNTERAFKEYQLLLERYPKFDNYQEVLQRQFEIANAYLGGKWFRLWGVIPFFPSMERTVAMYEKIVKNGPYSPVAPRAQLNIGAAREQQSSFFNRVDPFREAVQAYEKAADRYHDKPEVASEALFKAGVAYYRQASKADYDQSVAGLAITTFRDFITLYPNDPRAAEAQQLLGELRAEQARGNFSIARYYEKRKKLPAAMIYYNESYVRDPNGPLAEEARKRLDALRLRTGLTSNTATNAP